MKWPEESLLDFTTDDAVGLFDLTVGLWMSYGGIAYVDSQVLAETLELLRGEVRSIVRDDAVWHTKPVHYGIEELDDSFAALVGDRHGFDPLGEFVDCDQEEDVTSWRGLWQFADHVEAHWAKGQASGIGLSSDPGACGLSVYL